LFSSVLNICFSLHDRQLQYTTEINRLRDQEDYFNKKLKEKEKELAERDTQLKWSEQEVTEKQRQLKDSENMTAR